MSKKFSEILWVDKYRPKKISDLILPDRIKSRFIDGDIGANLLLGGSTGIGKTSLAKILAQGRSTLFINGSDKRGIDVVRHQVVEFASTNSLISTKKKIILIDEFDKFTPDAQDALKATMEMHSNNVLFICTSNHPERLIKALHSRLEYINFDLTKEEQADQQKKYIRRIQFILKNEGNYSIDVEALRFIFKQLYPDMRKIINSLYQATRGFKDGDTITIKHLSSTLAQENTELYELLITEYRPEMLYKYIKSNYTGQEFDTLSSLGTHFLEYLNNHEKHNDKTLSAAMIVHKYMFEATTGSINPLIPLLACAGMLSSIFKTQ